jgi:16S rRNA (cytosine967-C5)-methyltransferase
VLVYATCSFEPEETSGLLAAALGTEWRPSPLRPRLDRYGCGALVDETSHELTLLPHVHGTDGFYVARFERAKG